MRNIHIYIRSCIYITSRYIMHRASVDSQKAHRIDSDTAESDSLIIIVDIDFSALTVNGTAEIFSEYFVGCNSLISQVAKDIFHIFIKESCLRKRVHIVKRVVFAV